MNLHTLINHVSSTILSIPFILLMVVTILTFVVWFYFKSVNVKSTPLPPGPRGLPILGSLLFLEPELHTYFTNLGQAYGPIVKLQLGSKLIIIINSPSAASEVLKLHDATCANRDAPVAGRAATYGGSNIVWTSSVDEWRMLRKVSVLKMLNPKTLDAMYGLRRREVRKFVGHLYNRVGSGVNVGEQMFLTVLNVITSMMWGGTVAEGAERERLAADFRGAVAEMVEMLGAPNVSDFFPGLARFDLQRVKRRVEVVARRFDGIFEEVIKRRVEMDGGDLTERKDFLECLLEIIEEGVDDKIPFTMTHLKALLMDMVVGGSDSSSNSLEFAMAEIMNNPQVMAKIQQELDTVVGRDNIVEETHIKKLPYLLAVMKESLRLHVPLPLLVPHSPSQTCIIGGYTIPEGSRIFINAWAIHRDPSIWENPLEFDPERFLNGKWDFSGNDFRYIPFGSGRRICVGAAMAERMILYLLATLLHSFDWKLPNGEKLDLSEEFGIVMKKKIPLVAVPTPRLSHPSLYE